MAHCSVYHGGIRTEVITWLCCACCIYRTMERSRACPQCIELEFPHPPVKPPTGKLKGWADSVWHRSKHVCFLLLMIYNPISDEIRYILFQLTIAWDILNDKYNQHLRPQKLDCILFLWPKLVTRSCSVLTPFLFSLKITIKISTEIVYNIGYSYYSFWHMLPWISCS